MAFSPQICLNWGFFGVFFLKLSFKLSMRKSKEVLTFSKMCWLLLKTNIKLFWNLLWPLSLIHRPPMRLNNAPLGSKLFLWFCWPFPQRFINYEVPVLEMTQWLRLQPEDDLNCHIKMIDFKRKRVKSQNNRCRNKRRLCQLIALIWKATERFKLIS